MADKCPPIKAFYNKWYNQLVNDMTTFKVEDMSPADQKLFNRMFGPKNSSKGA